ncbi:LCP family protein [Kitasatospora sp. GP82]|uniref:LCP family protein n=1 Tax=Kitasatospora sp. GP82 TaxID=3035089 RepID=UPI002476946E|nr:LCP family protein [Kitasatospora sp. GP82]MDH6125183.1 anionic cell wall polymer biosynthesis LytR-Cps2A-Psr (LCP) family protein [Kitasatospora sp. GP82]
MTGTSDRRGPTGDGWYPQPGYDAYGRPEHGQAQGQPEGQYQYGQQQAYVQDQYQQGYQQQPYEPYEQQGYYQQQPQQPQQPQPQQSGYDPYGQAQQPQQLQEYYYQQQPVVQAVAQPVAPPPPRSAEPLQQQAQQQIPQQVRQPARPSAKPQPEHSEPALDDYATGEFTFVDEPAEETEDVIDWLKFAESRTERRDERKRRLRNRLIAVVVALVVLAGGGAGYLWWSGASGPRTAAAAAGARQVNVVHLRELDGKVSSALLVNDAAGHKGSILLLPETLKLPSSGDSSTAPLGQAMEAIGPSSTRDGLSTVLGATVAGTWRLDTPYLRLLVAQLGGVKVDTNAEVKASDGKVLAPAGKGISLTGEAAVAYATYQAPGEGRDAQLARFGQVLEALVRTMPTDLPEAQDDVHRMNAVLDPSLPEQALAGVLAQLAQLAKDGNFAVGTLKVQPDGTLDDATAGAQVKEVLGGAVHKAQGTNKTARVSIVNASGNDQLASSALVQVTNSGLDPVPSGSKVSGTQALSEIRYTDDARLAVAKSLAISLGLKETAVKKTTDSQNADLVVVLGKDYQPSKAQ